MKVLITGDRKWADWEVMYETLAQLPEDTTLIHGAAKGADTIGGKCAEQLGFEVVVVPAQWEKYGRAAGPIRNCQMLDMDPDFVIAFHDDLENSKGTKHCVTEARKRDIEVVEVTTLIY